MSKDNARVYVGGLVEGIKKEDLEREFDKYGKLNSVWVALNPPGFAFIEFDNNKDAEDACEGMNGYELMGAKLKVEMSRPRDRDRNRGGRGGGGGFRSSFGGRGDGFRSQGGSGSGGGFQRSSFGGRQNYGDRNGGGGYGGGGGRQGGGFQNNYRSRSPLDRY